MTIPTDEMIHFQMRFPPTEPEITDYRYKKEEIYIQSYEL